MPPRLKWPLYLLAAFPVADYFLHVYPWGIVGAAWDKLVFILLAFYAIRARMSGTKRKMYPSQRYIIFVAVLGLAYILMDVGYLTVAFAGWRVDYLYMLFSIVLPYVVDREDIIPLLKFMVLIGFLMAIHGVYEYVMKAPIPSSWINLGEHVRTRVYSLFGSPNIFGSYVAFIAPNAAGLALYEKRKGPRIFYIAAAIISMITLVFTFTRGAWVAFFVGALVFTWLVDKRLTIIAVVLTVLAIFFVPPIHARMDQFLSPVYWVKTEQSGRIDRWGHAYNQMRKDPLFGAGLGRYGGAVASKYFGIIYVDNYYAKTLAETGLLGLLSYLGLLFVYLRDVYRVLKRTVDPRMRYLMIGVFSSLIVVVSHNAVENIFEVPSMNYLFWMVGTLVLIYGAEGETER
ncbi:MAG: O-antigen ligase family protein [Acidibacillus sp.]|uniref:O-antigen ligase-related domain-containing protein n=1 Tax=Sulfoacidibacillus ferrooxidans TaxID=2005001 RepID=A0A9X2ACA3_9BACL|nr:O-antigen ligase family protein [Sulfoacidibacillus ferrooxidans]MCI0183564.1 hypothetical protein [Sulfoacidibacillus ferrooxidans]MCY0892114.1 O-antigen ligase family protein [Acidibacillus sp.]